ncbi:MAG: lysine--tRNA ligase [Planctomycetes bacterium]|nr:lysine--tRNA ligase [Planctomycetota bacterium]
MTDEAHQESDSGIHRLEQHRRDNRRAVAELGLSPYGSRTPGLETLAAAAARYDPAADAEHKERGKEDGFEDRRPAVKVAGRVVLHRDNGSLVWMNIRDDTGDLQIAISKRDCPDAEFRLAKITDVGDVVVAEGPLVRTRTGEVTVWAFSLRPASKCLIPPPEKHAGLQDVELRYRQRYIDMWANPRTLRVFKLRSKIVSRTRRFLDERGFLEVETPMLQSLAGGAAARPFITHMNALDLPLFMRIAPELYLKRLLVGGLPRVYEINRNFRNEGLDKHHNPEFTSLEVYEAFGDYSTMMELTESLIRELAQLVAVEFENASGRDADEGELHVGLTLPFGDLAIDYGSPFERVTYAELFRRVLGFAMTDARRARAEAKKRGLKHDGLADALVVNELFERIAEPTLDPARPTFVTDYPAALSPLTRTHADDPELAQRWDLFIGGMEIGPAYTELNDPDIQDARFREQLAGIGEAESTFRTLDEDFLRALKVGMPPAGGLGLGIDRIVMLLTNQRTIRDVILFPLMRPAD